MLNGLERADFQGNDAPDDLVRGSTKWNFMSSDCFNKIFLLLVVRDCYFSGIDFLEVFLIQVASPVTKITFTLNEGLA